MDCDSLPLNREELVSKVKELLRPFSNMSSSFDLDKSAYTNSSAQLFRSPSKAAAIPTIHNTTSKHSYCLVEAASICVECCLTSRLKFSSPWPPVTKPTLIKLLIFDLPPRRVYHLQVHSLNMATTNPKTEREAQTNADSTQAVRADGLELTSLVSMQSADQQLVLDTVDQLRQCGCDSYLSLPQLVVCGDQSAGKSSVLEALTQIDFPRNDGLCTRFATEIILRRAATSYGNVKIIPAKTRSSEEQESLSAFNHTAGQPAALPELISKATKLMGIGENGMTFSKDLLRIEIAGPTHPQLTVIDLPGLIQNGNSSDIQLVRELTEHYISSARTICLAVVAATHDHANQAILHIVQNHNASRDRTLGIVTKPDRPEEQSGMERTFISLARNEQVPLKLGWHVLKNRGFSEAATSFVKRNESEAEFFLTKPGWNALPKENVGIDELCRKLSSLLFIHVQKELPRLQQELETRLSDVQSQVRELGPHRSSRSDCKHFLVEISSAISSKCKAAKQGEYYDDYFWMPYNTRFKPATLPGLRRLRAAIQAVNAELMDNMRKNASQFKISAAAPSQYGIGFSGFDADSDEEPPATTPSTSSSNIPPQKRKASPEEPGFARPKMPKASAFMFGSFACPGPEASQQSHGFVGSLPQPKSFAELGSVRSEPSNKPGQSNVSYETALGWVKEMVRRSRGTELAGNFNPHIIGEFFIMQSSRWPDFARKHVDHVDDICSAFFQDVLNHDCPKDIKAKLWPQIEETLRARKSAASQELTKLEEDLRQYPQNTNHYYTDTIQKRRRQRQAKLVSESHDAPEAQQIPTANGHVFGASGKGGSVKLDWSAVAINPDMEHHGCEEVLDSVQAIYKVWIVYNFTILKNLL